MHPALRSFLLPMLALAGMASLAAWISNAVAAPSRRLTWTSTQAALPAIPPKVPEPSPSEPLPFEPDLAPSKPSRPTPPRTVAVRPGPRETREAAPSAPIREIGGQEAWEAFRAGLPFLDARRSADFAEGHIPGAWSVPVWEADVDDRLFAFKVARRPGSEDPIVIYCSGGDCKDSHLLAAKLVNEGYFHLLIYRDGFPDWLTQKHPMEKGRP